MSALRACLAAALALALVGLVVPAMEDATAARADAAAQREAGDVGAAVDALLASDAARGTGARRTVRVALPEGPGRGVAFVAVGGRPGGSVPGDGPRSDVVTYRVEGGQTRVAVRLPVDLRVAGSDDRALVVRDAATVGLRLDRSGGRRVVRAFKPGNATTAGRVA